MNEAQKKNFTTRVMHIEKEIAAASRFEEENKGSKDVEVLNRLRTSTWFLVGTQNMLLREFAHEMGLSLEGSLNDTLNS